jgi:molecular chaperone DnaJ
LRHGGRPPRRFFEQLATNVKRDYYEVLTVTRTASDGEIKSAYRKLALQYHPDRNPGDHTCEERFKECSEAYSILSDQQKRATYDRFGHEAFTNGGGGGQGAGGFQQVDLSDLFGEMFGFGDLFGNSGGGRGGRRSRAQRGNDLRDDLTITFENAAFGVEKQVTIRRHELCDSCHGSGAAAGKAPSQCRQCGGHGQVRYQQGFFSVARTCPVCQGTGTMIENPCPKCKGQRLVNRTHTLQVKVPAGVEDGTRILYTGHGDAGLDGGPAGDVYVVLHVTEHPFFERDGKDLHCAVPISFTQAALGATVKIPTLEGDGETTLEIPEGTQSGTSFRVRKKGVPVLNGSGRGDLFVEVKVTTPEKLTRQQRELMEQLAATLDQENQPQKRGLLNKMKDIFS